MRKNITNGIGLVLIIVLICSIVEADETIPEPESWSFPQVIESARAISPNNIEGRPFNKFGLVYSSEEVSLLKMSTMSAIELQKYADIVTHAYPDAVAKQLPVSCDDVPVKQLNGTAIAGIAYISLNALSENTRSWAATCLSVIQKKLSQQGR